MDANNNIDYESVRVGENKTECDNFTQIDQDDLKVRIGK